MKSRIILLGVLLGSLCQSPAAVAQTDALLAKANARAEQISDVDSFLSEIELALNMASRGEYGSLKRGDLSRMRQAQAEMITLLKGHERATELEPADRIAVYNAQELITATIRSDDKNRKICKRAPTTGSRLSKTECLTVRQREYRAREAAEVVVNLQSLNHDPDQGE